MAEDVAEALGDLGPDPGDRWMRTFRSRLADL